MSVPSGCCQLGSDMGTCTSRRLIGREYICQDGGQHEHDNDPHANERGALRHSCRQAIACRLRPAATGWATFTPCSRLIASLTLCSFHREPRPMDCPIVLGRTVAIPLWPARYVPSFPY